MKLHLADSEGLQLQSVKAMPSILFNMFALKSSTSDDVYLCLPSIEHASSTFGHLRNCIAAFSVIIIKKFSI